MRDAMGRVRTALVLGGTSDIGVAIASELCRRRYARNVVLAARDPSRAQERAEEIRSAGAAQVSTVAFDALDGPERHEAFVEEVWTAHGDIDVVVAAFGVLGDQLEAERDAVVALEIARTNYLGAISVGIPVAERLRTQGHGAFIVLSSVAAVRARRANFIYGSSKAGLDAFAHGLGDALAGSGARVIVVRPGFVRSKMTEGREEAPFATTPEAVAQATLEALDRGSPTVHVPKAVAGVATVLRNLPQALVRRLPT